MDFILALPPATSTKGNLDTALTVTDKFSKRINIIPGNTTFTAEDWAIRFWNKVYPQWGLPAAIISDRDPKFLSDFWTGLFKRAGTELLMSTAYHAQTDG